MNDTRRLPQRSVSELVAALRERARYITGTAWEAPATAAMMVEAADLLEALEAAAVALPVTSGGRRLLAAILESERQPPETRATESR